MSKFNRWLGNEDLTLQQTDNMIHESVLESTQADSALLCAEQDMDNSIATMDSGCDDLTQLCNYHGLAADLTLRNGGITTETAQVLDVAVETIVARLDIKTQGSSNIIPGVEHFSSSHQKKVSALAVEGLGDAVKAGIRAVIEFIKSSVEQILKFFDLMEAKKKALRKRYRVLLEKQKRHEFKKDNIKHTHSDLARKFVVVEKGSKQLTISMDTVSEQHRKLSLSCMRAYDVISAYVHASLDSKQINQNTGKETFSELLRAISTNLGGDIVDKDEIARIGNLIKGSEFVVKRMPDKDGFPSVRTITEKSVLADGPLTVSQLQEFFPDEAGFTKAQFRFDRVAGFTEQMLYLKHNVRKLGEELIKELEKSSESFTGSDLGNTTKQIRTIVKFIREMVVNGLKLNLQFLSAVLDYMDWGLDG